MLTFLVFLVLGLAGGIFMEIYILQFGKENDVTELKHCLEDGFTKTEELLQHYKQRYSLPLWLHLAVALHNVNQMVVLPLTLWMMLQEYRGLSRLGRVLANYVGLAPSLRTYDTLKNQMLHGATAEIARLTSSGRCILTMDNYAHQYGSSTLTTSRRTQYHLPSYTVGAVIEWPERIDVNISVRKINDGKWLTSVPEKVDDLRPFVDIVNCCCQIWIVYLFF
jgi:hypothetical protein